jgi:hypothetical protein
VRAFSVDLKVCYPAVFFAGSFYPSHRKERT